MRNIHKHSMDFVDAHEVFLHGNMYVVQSVRETALGLEKRYIGVGLFRGNLTTVVFIPRGDVIRIISWRCSDDEEIENYKKHHAKPNKS